MPRSLEINMLDLGAWAGIQAQVEIEHRGKCKRHEVLAESVEDAWILFEPEKLTNIFS